MTKQEPGSQPVRVRAARVADLPAVAELDGRITGLAKPEYWDEMFRRYGRRRGERFFLIAESDGRLCGFIAGEVRAWEFGSPPCGWIFAVNVEPEARLSGVGTMLFTAICDEFRRAGVGKIRTMLARDDTLVMSFFRSQGMMAGPYIQLEASLD